MSDYIGDAAAFGEHLEGPMLCLHYQEYETCEKCQARLALISAASKLYPPLTSVEVALGRRQIDGRRIADMSLEEVATLVEMTR